MFILFKFISPLLWRLGLGNIGQKIYLSDLGQSLLTKKLFTDQKEQLLGIEKTELCKLSSLLHKDDAMIETLLQRNLPEEWRKKLNE
jgi:hypothetical protein